MDTPQTLYKITVDSPRSEATGEAAAAAAHVHSFVLMLDSFR
jgi:hypothetical protein